MKTLPEKDVFTTGEIAKFCGLTKHTVLAAIERGELLSRLTLGGHNRIDRSEALRYLRRKGYLGESYGNLCILVIDPDTLVSRMISEIADRLDVDLKSAENAFDGGRLMERLHPRLVVCDLGIGTESCLAIVNYISGFGDDLEKRFMGIGTKSEATELTSSVEQKLNILLKPFTMNALNERLTDAEILSL